MIQSIAILIGIVGSVGAALVFGWGLGGGFLPAITVTFVWFWYLSFGVRILAGVLLAVLFEAASILPPGTYLILFLLFAGCAEALQTLVRDPWARGIGVGCAAVLFAAFFILRPVVVFILTALPS